MHALVSWPCGGSGPPKRTFRGDSRDALVPACISKCLRDSGGAAHADCKGCAGCQVSSNSLERERRDVACAVQNARFALHKGAHTWQKAPH